MKKALGPTKNRIPLLVIAGLFLILGLIVLINLEPPKNAAKAKAANDNTANEKAANEKAANDSAASAPQIAASPEAPESKPAEANRGAVVIVQPPAAPAAVDAEASTSAATTPPPAASMVTEADRAGLKLKGLLIPVAGVAASQLRDTFYDGRSEGRQHQALDIMAAGGTPVLAAADGKIVKLFQSDKGGITLYQLDSSGLYYYYYAHLQRYADGIAEGQQLKRGDVIAYVGDTGNAGAGNFHLHFAITKPSTPGKWSGGEPINPYPLLANH